MIKYARRKQGQLFKTKKSNIFSSMDLLIRSKKNPRSLQGKIILLNNSPEDK